MKQFATLNSYSQNAPKVFEVSENTQLLQTSNYGSVGVNNFPYRVRPLSYSTIGLTYNIPHATSQATSSTMDLRNAYTTPMVYAPVNVMTSPYYARAQCARNALYEN